MQNVEKKTDESRANELAITSGTISGEEIVKNSENSDKNNENATTLDDEETETNCKNVYTSSDLSSGDQPLIRNNTIEELKLKLEKKEIVFKPRRTPPTTPTNTNFEDSPDSMIPETRTPPLLTDDGLIAPRKPINPVREDPGRQNLHRELLFNQKIGKNVLNQKSELQRALEKHKDNLAKKQLDSYIAEKTPELEKVIADRARRLENPPKKENEEDKVINKEFLQARLKLKSTSDSK